MAKNRILARIEEHTEERKKDVAEAVSAMTNRDIREMETIFDYNSLKNINELEKMTLEDIEKNLIFHAKSIGKTFVEIGKGLEKAQVIFEKEGTESFMKWYKALGLDKDKVYLYINRYKLTKEYPEKKNLIVDLSDKEVKEVINKKTSQGIKEKVLSGELRTAKAIKQAREIEINKSVIEKTEKAPEEIEEGEIIETRHFFDANDTLRKLKSKISDLEIAVIELDGLKKSDLDKLQEALKLVNSLSLD
jgi:hypothetical protein